MKFATLPSGNLVISIDEPAADKEMLIDSMASSGHLDHGVLAELLEYAGWSANGEMYQIAPETLGALTDAPILADDVVFHDDGTQTVVGNIWWFPNYQVESFAETLLYKGEVVFTKVVQTVQQKKAAQIHAKAVRLVDEARMYNLVLNIESVPNKPLAMGNYHEVVRVRPARIMASK